MWKYYALLSDGEWKDVKTLSNTHLLFLILSGLATGIFWIFYFKALETGEVSKVAPIDKMSVAMAIGLSYLVLKEPVEIKTLVGGLFIIVGSMIILL